MNDTRKISPLAYTIADKYAQLPQVRAITLAGSLTNGMADEKSDLDFYIYVDEEISLDMREEIAREFADRLEINNQFWEPGDEWVKRDSDLGVDIMYRSPAWIEEQLNRILVRCEASVGYSTCFWYNVLTSHVLYDPSGWFEALKEKVDIVYPEALKKAIIAKNYPILKNNISSYKQQIQKAVKRQDIVSINHRIAALLASCFDIVFAVNGLPHPGEKRLIRFATENCARLPENMGETVEQLIKASVQSKNYELVGKLVNKLLGNLDGFLESTGFLNN